MGPERGGRAVVKLDLLIFPLVFLLRASLLVLALVNKSLKSRWIQGPYDLVFCDPTMCLPLELYSTLAWLCTIAYNAVTYLLMTILHWTYIVDRCHLNFFMLFYEALMFWPKFYWSILKPKEGRRSVLSMLKDPHSSCKTWCRWYDPSPPSKR